MKPVENKKKKAEEREPFVKPKLKFVEPKLENHGEFTKITGFFGTFSP